MNPFIERRSYRTGAIVGVLLLCVAILLLAGCTTTPAAPRDPDVFRPHKPQFPTP